MICSFFGGKISNYSGYFFKTQKYGLSLALFFPAILHHERWSLNAQIELRSGRKYQLELDQSCGIQPPPEHFSGYIPDDFSAFQKAFEAKVPDWELSGNNAFLELPGEAYCFPDYQLQHRHNDQRVVLELFHAWHATQLEARLKQLATLKSAPLLIGVDRKLTRDEDVEAKLKKSKYFQKWGFLFSDMPTALMVEKILKKVQPA